MKSHFIAAVMIATTISACAVSTTRKTLAPLPQTQEDQILTTIAYRIDAVKEFRGMTASVLADAEISAPFAPPLTHEGRDVRAYCVTYRLAAQSPGSKVHVLLHIFNNDLTFRNILMESGDGLFPAPYCKDLEMRPFNRLVELRQKRVAEQEEKRRAIRAAANTQASSPQ